MKKLFQEHLSRIKSYENAGPMEKADILEKTKKSLQNLDLDRANLFDVLKKLTNAAALIQYADAALVIDSECLTMEPEPLVETLAGYYNQLELNRLQAILKEGLSKYHEFPKENGLDILKIELMRIINLPEEENSSLLKQLLHTLENWQPNGNEEQQQKQVELLNQLRRRFLIKPLEEALEIEQTQKITDTPTTSEEKDPSLLFPILSNYKSLHSQSLFQELHNNADHVQQKISLENKNPLEPIITMMIQDIDNAKQRLSEMTRLRVKALHDELEKLADQKKRYQSNDAFKKLVKIIDKLEKQIRSLASSDHEDLNQLREVVEHTNLLLNSQGTTDDISLYEDFAKSLQQGKSSPGLSALGATMLVLSVTFVALGLAVLLSPLVAGVAAATALTASITFFVTGSQKGLSKTTCNLAEYVESHPEVYQNTSQNHP